MSENNSLYEPFTEPSYKWMHFSSTGASISRLVYWFDCRLKTKTLSLILANYNYTLKRILSKKNENFWRLKNWLTFKEFATMRNFWKVISLSEEFIKFIPKRMKMIQNHDEKIQCWSSQEQLRGYFLQILIQLFLKSAFYILKHTKYSCF